MSDDVTNTENVVEEGKSETSATAESPKPVPKPKPKAKKSEPKKASKPVKAEKKPVKKPAKKESRPAKDDARKVATASGGNLTTDKVRILRSLGKGRPTTMNQIKTGCGIAEGQKYSGTFLNGLHDLQKSKYVKAEKDQDQRAYNYTITEKGKAALQKAEAAAKAK